MECGTKQEYIMPLENGLQKRNIKKLQEKTTNKSFATKFSKKALKISNKSILIKKINA